MRRLVPALVLLLAAPLRADELPLPLVDEVRQAVARAREAYEKAHGMPPSLERNEALSAAKQEIRAAQGKQALLKDIAPDRAKAFAQDMTDLQGMLFWANKSMVVVVPPSAARPPPPPPEPVQPEPTEPGEPEPPAPAPPPPPPGLSEEDRKRVLAALTELCAAYAKAGASREDLLDAERRQKDIFAVLDAIQDELKAKGSNWNDVKSCEARRSDLLEALHRSRKSVQSRYRELRLLKARILDARSLLERHQGLLDPVLGEWLPAHPAEELPEGMVAYANGRLSGRLPSCFTPAPASAPEAPAKAAQEAARLLGELSEAADRLEDLEEAALRREADSGILRKELEDLKSHWSWRTSNTAWGVSEAKRVEQEQLKLQSEIDDLAKETSRAAPALEKARGRLEALRTRLDALDPSLARAVDAWRRAAKHVPAAAVEALEAWARRAGG